MKRPARGHVHERITAISGPGYPIYAVCGDTGTVLIDSGVNLLGPHYLAAIEEAFPDKGRLGHLFLTHSHWDHVGSAAYLRRNLPGLKLGAHERVAALVRKPSALETMNRLSLDNAEFFKYNTSGEDLTLRPFEIDVILKEGDEYDLGGLTCRVCETPGHTRDSLAYYFPEIKALFPGDACGVLRKGPGTPVQAEFLASFQQYVDSIERMIALEPELICLAHNWVLAGDEALEFLRRSEAETFRCREAIEQHLDEANGDIQEAVRRMARDEYDTENGGRQPPASYLTNLNAQVAHIAEIRGRS